MSHQKKNPRSPVINGNHYLNYASVRHAASVSGTRHSRRDSLATKKKTPFWRLTVCICHAMHAKKKRHPLLRLAHTSFVYPVFRKLTPCSPAQRSVGRSTRDTVPENRRKLYLTYVHNPNTHTTPVLRHFNWPLYEK